MTKEKNDKSVSVGSGSIVGTVQTGNENVANVVMSAEFPPQERVDMHEIVQTLQSLTSTIESADQRKIANAIDDIDCELQKAEPDKAEVGTALQRVMVYCRSAALDVGTKESIKHAFMSAISWLGDNWHHLLQYLPR